ncbi:MAG: hypothetical protein ACRDPE_04640 [Solirubrobacterales bacterium]
MHRVRGKLTYSNVISTLCLVLLLGGGTAYAASHLRRESVGTGQLKKEAVTPAKLSKRAKVTLTGPVGPTGPTGARGADGQQGPQGLQGPIGPQGPAAISIDFAIPQDGALHEVGTYDGVKIEAGCNASSSQIVLKPTTGGKTMDLYGTNTFVPNAPNDTDLTGSAGITFLTGSANHEMDLDEIGRNTQVGATFAAYKLHAGGLDCAVKGMVIPSGS